MGEIVIEYAHKIRKYVSITSVIFRKRCKFMKKNFSRALSLLLVLVMILGAMPMAMATEPGGDPAPTVTLPTSVTVTPSTAAPKAGEPVTFTVSVPAGFTASSYTWTNAIGSTATATATYTAAGSQTVGVTVVLTSIEDPTVTGSVSGSTTVTVAEAEIPATGLVISGATTVAALNTLQLSVVATPSGASLPSDVVWSSSNTSIATVNKGLVSARQTGTVTITASSASMNLSATHVITVTDVVVTVNVTPSSLTLNPNEKGRIGGTFSPSTAGQYITTTMTSNNRQIATVDGSSGTVTGVAAGSTYITIKCAIDTRTAPSYLRFAGGKTTWEVDIPVTVNSKYYIGNVSSQSAMAGSTITLNPILYNGKGERVSNANFSVQATGCSLTNNGTSWYATSTTPGSATVTFTVTNAEYKNDGVAVTKTVNLGFYRSNTLMVNVRDNISSFRFYDKGVIVSSSIGYNTNYTTLTMTDLIGMAMPTTGSLYNVDYYSFGVSGSNGGELLAPTSGSSLSWTGSSRYVDKNNLDAVGFQQKSSSNKTSNFTIYAMSGSQSDGVIVGMLTLQINAGAASGGIEYSTNSTTPVTFKVADFQNYWNAHKNDQYGYGNNTNSTYDCGCHGQRVCYVSTCRYYGTYNNGYYNSTETLSYVTFGISNTVPAYGTLYTTTAKSVKATAGMQFRVSSTGYNNNNTYGNYLLSSVTYVPSTTYTAAYSVDIPFTAYGTNGTAVTGYVSIKLNEQGNTIGARGTTIGENTAASIAANYYAAKGQYMSYVVFELPSAQQATLYRSIPKTDGYSRVTEAVKVVAGDRFYYNGTNSSYTYGSTYNQYVTNNNLVNCGCNNLYTCYNTWCKYYDGNSYNNSTIDCGCHNNYYCNNSYCMYYDGTNYNNNNYNYNNNYNTQLSANQMPLTDVSIVPAAGFKGKLTLKYTAYSAGNANQYTGDITYDVETQTASKVFSDVKGSYSWAADSADFLYYEGTAQGSNGKYNPSANITRGDFMLMLYRAFLADDYSTTAVTDNFSDVAKGTSTYSQETYQAVGIAKKLGIAQGTNGKFNPKSNITREEAMVLIYRTLDECNRTLRYKSSTNASSFSDYSKISTWATTAISSLVGNGVIQGSNNKITPKSNITRAEMACILHRVITY